TLFVAGLDDETRSIRVIIRDAAGNTVRSLSPASFPCAWDLTDQQGERVPDGRYKASALISTDSAFGHTPEIDIIVLE
ncbi:MAG: hypothetical protein K2F79_05315, partial [Muribaculaceae bacterium]|nr:hypothetical protein [Muribaculaceae bacterium]